MLEILLHGAHVGTLVQEERTGVVSFVLEEGYMEAIGRPVLGQQFEDRREHRVFRQVGHPGRLPTFFANLLPEGALKELVSAIRPMADDAATLAMVGGDLPGAVLVRPTGEPVAGSVSGDFKSFDEPKLQDVAMADALRFSLAGVQLKFSAVREPANRFTLPFRGMGGRWILKFGSRQYHKLPENEHFVMQWAASCGITVPRNELIEVASIDGIDPRFAELGPRVFVIERYDRLEGDQRIHQEDFAQVRGVHPDEKYRGASYEGLARFVGDLCGQKDMIDFLRRVFFSILAGNTDAHLKNWSLIYPDRRTARLAPAYDLVFVRAYLPEDKLSLPLAKERDPMRIGWEHVARVERFLRQHGHAVAVTDVARQLVEDAVRLWNERKGALEEPFRSALDQYLRDLPLAKP